MARKQREAEIDRKWAQRSKRRVELEIERDQRIKTLRRKVAVKSLKRRSPKGSMAVSSEPKRKKKRRKRKKRRRKVEKTSRKNDNDVELTATMLGTFGLGVDEDLDYAHPVSHGGESDYGRADFEYEKDEQEMQFSASDQESPGHMVSPLEYERNRITARIAPQLDRLLGYELAPH